MFVMGPLWSWIRILASDFHLLSNCVGFLETLLVAKSRIRSTFKVCPVAIRKQDALHSCLYPLQRHNTPQKQLLKNFLLQ